MPTRYLSQQADLIGSKPTFADMIISLDDIQTRYVESRLWGSSSCAQKRSKWF